MILCDTDILIEFFKKNETIVSALRDIGQVRLAVSHVTVAELYFGALNKAELGRIRRDLAMLRAYPLSLAISQRFLALMETYSLSHKLSLPDALIAATALEYDLTLFTRNLKDFRFIAGLQLHGA
jgi:tRNA(fMet)-specific endonuclease VapC